MCNGSKRRHIWSQNPPEPGRSFCVRCSKRYSGQGRKMHAPHATTLSSDPLPDPVLSTLVDVAADVSGVAPMEDEAVPSSSTRQASGTQDDAAASVLAPVVVEKTGPTWCTFVGSKLAGLYVDCVEAVGSKLKPPRKMNEPEDADVEQFGQSLAAQLAIWFPDSALSPGKQCLISAATIAMSMYVGAEKLPHSIEPVKSNGAAKAKMEPEIAPVETWQAPPPVAVASEQLTASIRKIF